MAESKLYFDLADIVAPAHTMLVVWDMQNMLVERVFNKNEVLNSVGSLLQASRNITVPVVYTKITPLPARFQAPASVAQRMKRMGITDPKQMRPWGKTSS